MNNIFILGFIICILPFVIGIAGLLEGNWKMFLAWFFIPPILYASIVLMMLVKIEEKTIDRKVLFTDEMVPITSKVNGDIVNLGKRFDRSFKEGDTVKEKVKIYHMKVFGTFKESSICLD